MAARKPVVCFDIAGPGFHIDKTCGIKIKTENTKQAIVDMAEALERLYKDNNLKNRLGVQARIKIERDYSWENLGSWLQKIYKEKE
jgi:glycosyltransferase involved in cell wall biosynthesis